MEITRVVTNDIPVTVEVTRVVSAEVTVEVPVEVPVEVGVTRMVEVPVTVMATAVSETEATPTPTAVPATVAPTPEATEDAVVAGIYTVKPGDTMFTIYVETGVPMADIVEANNISNFRLISVGQQLIIPGWPGTPTAESPSAAQPTRSSQTAAATGANLLPNPSFEDDWYFFNGVDEWQLPVHWLLAVDEGPNTLTPGSGGNFLRPEIRLLTSAHLPPTEQQQFVFDGQKTIKAFKGGAPTNFAIFTDVPLLAGRYRFTIQFFPDTVSIYNGSEKVWNQEPLAAEYRIIFNNAGTGWSRAIVGTRNLQYYDFTLTTPQTVRLGGAFRNRFNGSNNGWFIDNWSLQTLP